MKSAKEHFADAERLEEQGKYKDAIQVLDKAISKDQNFLGAYINRGADKSALGEFLQNFIGDSEYNKGVSMRLWDAETGQLLQTFRKHSNDVNDVAFSRDGKSVASASYDMTIGLWQLSKQ